MGEGTLRATRGNVSADNTAYRVLGTGKAWTTDLILSFLATAVKRETIPPHN